MKKIIDAKLSNLLSGVSIAGPLLLMCLAVFSFFVLGRFEKIFNEFEVTLPLMTKMMINSTIPTAALCLSIVLLILTSTPSGKSIGYFSFAIALVYLFLLINALFIPMISMIKSLENSS